MIKNEIYSNLTERQLEILNEVTEGKDLTNREQRSDATGDLFMKHGEENFLEPNGISDEYKEDLNEVERYLKSLGDNDQIRTENLLKEAIKIKEIYREKLSYNIIHQLGQTYGFTDTQVEKSLKSIEGDMMYELD